MQARLSADAPRQFKRTATNENHLIAAAIESLLPPGGGLIVDVGAGLGDIARLAFRQREAVLLDILEFDDPISPLHRRENVNFFDYMPPPETPIDVMIFSHVLQYIDDDVSKFLQKVSSLSPQYIITTLNSPAILWMI